MLFSALALLLAGSPLVVNAFPAYARRLSVGGPTANKAREPILRRTAEPYTSQFPYTGALLDGKAGTGKGGVQVPAPGDTAHYYQDPPPGAQRGPCPGLNTLANHGFISRDGITTWTEVVAALQNVYNIDYRAAIGLITLGIVLDGDPVSELISIGGSVPLVTGKHGDFTGDYGGVSDHGTFELDVSLTRSDYYLNGDCSSFNGTMFGMMVETAKSTSTAENPLFDQNALALYRSQRYDQARVENPWLYFPQLALHNYGAATFLYKTFPSSAKNNTPDLETISSFFGAVQQPNGTWTHVGERPPANWHNQVVPLTDTEIAVGMAALYTAYPKPFGANINGTWYPSNSTGSTTNYTSPFLTKRQTNPNDPTGILCQSYDELIYHALNSPQPFASLSFIIRRANAAYEPVGCNLFTFAS